MKTCSKCGECKPYDAFALRPAHSTGRRSECRECAKREFEKWRAANADRERSKARDRATLRRKNGLAQAYEAVNADRLKAIRDDWVRSNADRVRELANKRATELTDAVVRGRIIRSMGGAGLNLVIPQDLINLKREQIRLHRLARELKQEITNQLENENGN